MSSYNRDHLTTPRYMYCPKCKTHQLPEEGNTCPICGTKSKEIKCTRCKMIWTPRKGVDPGPDQCCFCHSYLYDRKPKDSEIEE